MPTCPSNTICAELGCNEPRSRLNSYCLKHGGIDNIPKRETDSIYQTPAWRSIRQRQLSIQPLCQACLARGIVAEAVHVDHVFPWKQIGKHAFMRNIFQSLCHADHSYKTGLEKKGEYIHYAQGKTVTYNKHDYSHLVQDSYS